MPIVGNLLVQLEGQDKSFVQALHGGANALQKIAVEAAKAGADISKFNMGILSLAQGWKGPVGDAARDFAPQLEAVKMRLAEVGQLSGETGDTLGDVGVQMMAAY